MNRGGDEDFHSPLSLTADFPGNLIMSKISPKLMACFHGVVSHLSWLKIHQTKITSYDYHQPKGFQDKSTYTPYMG